MVDSPNYIATFLQELAQTFCPWTYTSAGGTPALTSPSPTWGLQTCPLYQKQVVAQGQQILVESYQGLVNEGGKCSD